MQAVCGHIPARGPSDYHELRKLAAAHLVEEESGHTLQATALAHEADLRLVGNQQFNGRGHFFTPAAEAIRRILVEQARGRLSLKRGASRERESLEPDQIAAPAPDEELLALHEALNLLATQHPQKADRVKLRYFAGLTSDEAAATLGISPARQIATGTRTDVYSKVYRLNSMIDIVRF